MRIDVLTLFPEMFDAVTRQSVTGRGIDAGAFAFYTHNIRDYTLDKHNRVDDYPYGGGRGMILQAQPVFDCFQAVCDEAGSRPYCIYMSPQGKVFTQTRAEDLAKQEHIALLCGHYEGVDERVLEEIVDEELSIGDYVLTGGELAAMTVVDSVARLLPGVLAEEICYTEESISSGLIEYPQYTRPAVWNGREVPEVLLSGHHARIAAWRLEESLRRTERKRPDLMARYAEAHRDDPPAKKKKNQR